MKPLHKYLAWLLVLLPVLFVSCDDQLPTEPGHEANGPEFVKGEPGPPSGQEAGNNLSYPVIWAEGVTKVVPGTPGMTPLLTGEWWYWWGTEGVDPNIVPLSCPPDPDDNAYCDDGLPGTVGTAPEQNADLVRAFVQKDPQNQWQAGTFDGSAAQVNVDLIDWGDNLESVDWYTRSQVRTEIVLYESATAGDAEPYGFPMLEYEMRHTSGWGIDEAHGLAALPADPAITPTAILGVGEQATVYTHCARLTIQKLNVDRDDARLADLEWVPGEGWVEPEGYPDDLINPHLFNGSVHEGGDGPGYYSAEVNVKGKIIFGYTWNVRKLNEGAGNYRITFSLDSTCGTATLNTYFVDGITEIMQPLEEEETALASAFDASVADEGGDTGGGTGVLDTTNNLTYIDIVIHERGGGGGGGGGGKKVK
jgi:hypothetical protein